MMKSSKPTFQTGIYPKGKYQLQDLLDAIKQEPRIGEIGAIMTFTGIVRGISQIESTTSPVTGMLVEANKTLANIALEKICRELEKGEVERVLICHLEGKFSAGDDMVYVVVAGGHRQAVFAALQAAIEKYKTTAAIWKKEILADGSQQWVH